MCIQDLQLGRLRYSKLSRIIAIAGSPVQALTGNANRVGLSLAPGMNTFADCVTLCSTQDNTRSAFAYFTLSSGSIFLDISQYGSLLTGDVFLFSPTTTGVFVIVEILTDQPTDLKLIPLEQEGE